LYSLRRFKYKHLKNILTKRNKVLIKSLNKYGKIRLQGNINNK